MNTSASSNISLERAEPLCLPSIQQSTPWYISNPIFSFARKINSFVYDWRHLLFFAVTSAIAAAPYPHTFLTGLPLGIVSTFFVGQAIRQMPSDPSFYLCRKLSYEAGIVQTTLSQVSAITKTWSYLYTQPHLFEVTSSERIFPALTSGIIAGAFLCSTITYIIDTAYFNTATA